MSLYVNHVLRPFWRTTPSCFHLYSTPHAPSNCTFKEVKGAKMCDKPLFYSKSNYHGISDKGAHHLLDLTKLLVTVDVPRSTYMTQDIFSWLMWFLNKKETECNIKSWTTSVCQKLPSVVEDVQQSPTWKSLKWLPKHSENEPPPLHLALNIFIDWFNPAGNKQAGKKHSMGLIAFNCLNLPPSTQHLFLNYCIAGIMPGIHEPSVTTINHVLAPIIDQLLVLNKGFRVSTHQYPGGRVVQVKLLGLVGDIVATHKVAGYTSHSTTSFCSYCVCTVKERPVLQLGNPRLD
ncbi:hypothetical protein CROQUDRAFT_681475 [Cronartium quercuum f. sp. fusiforme G11]|uniref:Uncharacterized protein n=1 Tax=Cronartium quercuum f. sp. fusiforme G11 TaxID=708437 RepID=A0A9P6T7Z6_9BASI|nr:hypothetical protein CROQUDRAFT_681475 [Cronartium quercuum f. sp. fusiforme G11]